MISLIIILFTFCGALGGLFFKISTSKITKVTDLLFSKEFYLGVIIYLISASMNIYVLKFLPYTIVLPLTSITYIWTLILARYYLKENVNVQKKVGVFLIILGTILVIL